MDDENLIRKEILDDLLKVILYNETFHSQLSELMHTIDNEHLWLVSCPARTQALEICNNIEKNERYILNTLYSGIYRNDLNHIRKRLNSSTTTSDEV